MARPRPLASPAPAAQAGLSSLSLERGAFALLGLTLAVLPLFFYTRTQDQFELPKLVLLRCLSSLMAGLVLARLALDPERPWRRSPLDWPVLAWALCLIAATFTSVSPAVSWRGEYENFAGSLTQLNYCLLYFLALQLAPSLPRAGALLRCFEAGALGAGLYALMQAMQRDFIAWSSASIVADRFFASMGNPNFLGGLMVMAIPLRLARLARGWSSEPPSLRQGDWPWRLALLSLWVGSRLVHGLSLDFFTQRPGQELGATVVLAAFVLGLVAEPWLRRQGRAREGQALGYGLDLLVLAQALANTATRGAFGGLMAAVLVMALAWPLVGRGAAAGTGTARTFNLKPALLLLGALSLAFLGLGRNFRSRMADTLLHPGQAFETSRLQIWGPALEIFLEKPVLGTGVDTFKTVFPQHARSRFARYDGENVSSRMAHSEPLHVLATMGLVGLAIWLWLCAALGIHAWRRLAGAADGGEGWLALGLAGCLAGYLAQNLVSFGVSAISAPFFVLAALLFAGRDLPAARLRLPGPAGAWAGLAAVLALGGVKLATDTWRADLQYAFGNTVQSQVARMDSASLEDSRGMAAYALAGLRENAGLASPPQWAEAQDWVGRLQAAEQEAATPSGAASARPVFQRAAASLLLVLASIRQEAGIALAPTEVKYLVYLGLTYEELMKRSQDPARREEFFKRALAAYTRGSDLNPRNAYYHGNLGRLWGTGAELGSLDWLRSAEQHYLRAVELAPVTRLFYENLLLLYARFGLWAESEKLMQTVVARDAELAPALLLEAGSTLLHWSSLLGSTWPAGRAKEVRQASLRLAEKGMAMDKAGADTALLGAVAAEALGDRSKAKRYLDEALKRQPGHKDALAFRSQKRL